MKLFYDDEFDAFSQMISNSEKTPKEVACFLRPDLKPESAYAWLKACLNPHGDQRLKFGQIVAAMKFCDRFDPLFYACDETSHARPEHRSVEAEEAQVVEVMKQCAGTMERAMAHLDRLQERKMNRPTTLRSAG